MPRLSCRAGFSLLEILVVLGVIGILIGLTIPAVQQARASAARIRCANHMKQIGLGVQNYHDAHGSLPPTKKRGNRDPNSIVSWMVLILPHVEQDNLYRISVQACLTDADALHNPPHLGLATVVPLYLCAADGRLGTPLDYSFGVRAAYTSYVGIGGAIVPGRESGHDGVLGAGAGVRLTDVTDGTSLTVMLGERPPPDSLQAGWWYPAWWRFPRSLGFQGPNNTMILGGWQIYDDEDSCSVTIAFGPGQTSNPCDRYHLWSLHAGGANFLFADGAVRFLSYSSAKLVPVMATRAGGEPIQVPD